MNIISRWNTYAVFHRLHFRCTTGSPLVLLDKCFHFYTSDSCCEYLPCKSYCKNSSCPTKPKLQLMWYYKMLLIVSKLLFLFSGCVSKVHWSDKYISINLTLRTRLLVAVSKLIPHPLARHSAHTRSWPPLSTSSASITAHSPCGPLTPSGGNCHKIKKQCASIKCSGYTF